MTEYLSRLILVLTSSEPLPVCNIDGQVTEEARLEYTWTLMYIDDVLICSESRKEVEESEDVWAEKKKNESQWKH